MKNDDNLGQAIIRNKSGESVGILMPMLLKDLDTALRISKPLKYKKNNSVYSSSKISKESEVENGHSAEKTNGNRSNVSEREKTTEANTSEISQGKSANERAVDETLERLGLEYIDLLFIHQPAGNISRPMLSILLSMAQSDSVEWLVLHRRSILSD